MSSVGVTSPPRESSFRYENNANARQSSAVPIALYAAPANIDPALAFQSAPYFDDFVITAHEAANTLDLFGPARRVQYPVQAGCFLRIEARAASSPLGNAYRHRAVLVLRLPCETAISRVSLMGNLLLPPYTDARGPTSNFGLPGTIRIYAVDDWPSILTIQTPAPHPREWRLVYEDADLRGLWGWTPLVFHPIQCRYLIFIFSELPLLGEGDKAVRGLSIQRLGVHGYEEGTNIGPSVEFSPIASWQSLYENQPNPFFSKYWLDKGISPVNAADHQSIYRDESLKRSKHSNAGVDLLPSALVGLPAQYRAGQGSFTAPSSFEVTQDGYLFSRYYSGDIVAGDRSISTHVILAVTEDTPPFIEGIQIEEPLPRRIENSLNPAVYPDSEIRVFFTYDREVAFSANPVHPGWKLIVAETFSVTFVPLDVKILFPYEVDAPYFRVEHRLLAAAPLPRRFEVTKLQLLRARHRPIVPCRSESLQLQEIRLRFRGRNLLDDQAFVDGRGIMDIAAELSIGGRPFQGFLSLRSVLDIRERTRSQIIANVRATRPIKQESHERVRQGTSMPNYATPDGVSAMTRTSQVIDPNGSRQRVVSASKQTSMVNAADPFVDAIIRQDPEITQMIANLAGVTTDRDSKIGAPPNPLQILQTISHLLGTNINQLLQLLQNARAWQNRNLADLFANLNPFGGGGPFRIPAIPALNPVRVIDPSVVLSGQLYNNPNYLTLPQRPSVSVSGSFGGQFFGGGSAGVSIQLDGGKSTSQSYGSQGAATETITKYNYSRTVANADIPDADVSRHVTRVDYWNRSQEAVWRGKEVLFGGKDADIILATIPVNVRLRPPVQPQTIPDRLRIRVGFLPPSVDLDVTFVGVAIPHP